MKNISYKIGCRSCMDSTYLNNIIYINDSEFELYDGRFQFFNMIKSEYDLGKTVREYLIETKQPCILCGSYNLHLFEILYDGTPVYNGFETTFGYTEFELDIRKVSNGDSIQVNVPNTAEFAKEAIATILGEIKMRIERDDFIERNKGHLKFVVSNRVVNNRSITRIEKFGFGGYSKDSAISLLNNIKDNVHSIVR